MQIKKTFAVIGGDMRYAHLANAIAQMDDSYTVFGLFLDPDVRLSSKVKCSDSIAEILPQCDVVVFAMPLLLDNGFINAPQSPQPVAFESCLQYLSESAVVLAGKVADSAQQAAQKRGIEIIDYLEREEFAVLNAVPTAEGAVAVALTHLPITLFGSTCLITGFGRISKTLAKLLRSFGANVRVAARRYSDLAWIKIYGYTAVHTWELKQHLSDVDVIFNTVPALILTEEKLSMLKRNCLVVDLASKPGGVDFEAAHQLGIHTEWALSLPGKVAPVSAADIILDTILNILYERGIMQ